MKKVLVITEFGCLVYNSLNAASKQTGISRTRLSRALNHTTNGYVPNTEPPVCVDLVDDRDFNRNILPSEHCLSCPHIKGGLNAGG